MCVCVFQLVGAGTVEEHICMIRVEVNLAGAVPAYTQAGGANRLVTEGGSRQ